MRHRLWSRLGPALLVGAGLLLSSAGPAVAADEEPLTGVARPDGTARTLLLGGTPTVVRGLQTTVDGGRVVPAFSLGYRRTQLTGNVTYRDTTWAEAGGNLPNAQWVIQQGYPSSDRARLIAAAGVTLPPRVSPATVDLLLRMGTQAAIWKRTDGVSLGAWRAGAGLGAQNEYAVVKNVYDHLTRATETALEPKRTVTFEEGYYVDAPDLTVRGPSATMEVEVENGYAFTDSRYSGGTWLVTEVANGGVLPFVRTVDPAKTTKVTVTAPYSVTPGIVFVAGAGNPPLTPARPYGAPVSGTFEKTFPGYGSGPAPQPSPSAGSPGPTPTATVPASPASPASPTAAPTGGAGGGTGDDGDGGGLPVTGAPTGLVVGGGLLLLVAGAAAVLTVRRHRLRFTS